MPSSSISSNIEKDSVPPKSAMSTPPRPASQALVVPPSPSSSTSPAIVYAFMPTYRISVVASYTMRRSFMSFPLIVPGGATRGTPTSNNPGSVMVTTFVTAKSVGTSPVKTGDAPTVGRAIINNVNKMTQCILFSIFNYITLPHVLHLW